MSLREAILERPGVREVVDAEMGHIFEDFYENNVRVLIMRGSNSLCAYMGVPADHPLADLNYDDLPVECHGGLTWSGAGDGKNWPKGWYWYGWDYVHLGDMATYHFTCDALKDVGLGPDGDDKLWTVKDVKGEMWEATYYFSKLMSLVEGVARRRPQGDPQ